MPGGPEGGGPSPVDMGIEEEDESDERVHDIDTARDRAIASNPHHTAAKEWGELSTQEHRKAAAVLTDDGALRGGGQRAREDSKALSDMSRLHRAIELEERDKARKIDDGEKG